MSSPTRQQFATTFRRTTRISFWVQLALTAVFGIALLFALFSRTIAAQSKSTAMGISLFLAVGVMLALCFRIYLAFRYTRLAKRLQTSNPQVYPNKKDTVRIIRTGLIVSLVGILLGFVGSEISVVATLAKALAQPQGRMIYEPETIIQTLDVLIILVNTNITGAHLVGGITSLFLLSSVKQN